MNEEKLYSYKDAVKLIRKGWNCKEELKECFDKVNSMKMDEDNLRKLAETSEINILYDSYSYHFGL